MKNKKLLSFLVFAALTITFLGVSNGKVLAQTTSIEELQKQINQLLEVIKNLQEQLNNLRGQTQPVTPVVPDQGWEKVYGSLSAQGSDGFVSIYMWGTHKITEPTQLTYPTKEGKTYLVKAGSNEVLEMLNKYVGQNVTLWGQLQYQNTEGGFWGFTAHKVYPDGYTCVVPASAKIGYSGDDVKVVQKYLATDKTIYPEGLVTGYYGILTKKAVERYQQRNGLPITGEVSGVTAEKLEIAVENTPTFVCPVPPKPIPPPNPNPNQGFNVYSPSAGETWVPGQTYKIAWNQVWPTIIGPGIDPYSPNATQQSPATAVSNTTFAPIGAVKITLHKYISCLYPEKSTDPICMIAEVMPYVISEKADNNGYFAWTIPADLAETYKGQVIIKVSSVDGGFNGRSGVFTIGSGGVTPPPVTPVKVYSPASGENWYLGQSYKIAWSAQNFGQMGPVTIYLTKYQDPYSCPIGATCAAIGLMPYTIVKEAENVGFFTWTIPKDLGLGYQGKMRIMLQGADGSYSYGEVFNVLPGTTSNLPPVVTGVSGPTNLKVGETGTWTVRAYDPENGSLSYSVAWGDEFIMEPGVAPMLRITPTQNTATFTHTYNQVGTFNPTFYVADDKGQQARTSIGVVVGGGTATNQPPVIKTFQFQNGVTTLKVGQMYALNYLAVDPEGTQVKYTIDFGDGAIETASMFAAGTIGTSLHTYTTAGTKTLKLTATDANGLSATQSFSISVVDQNIGYQILNLNQGWNFISFYRLPEGRELRNIFTDPWFGYVDYIKTNENGAELVYDRANNINTLKTIKFDKGYKVYANQAFSMYVYGLPPTQSERTTRLVRGVYNFVGYPSETSRKVDQVFSSVNGINNAMISSVKDAAGNMWTPGYPNWIGDMKPGQGYEVWINPEFTNNQDIDFTFPQ